MKNPFVFDRPLGSEPQIQRNQELKELEKRFDNGVNTRLASPRDYGKTSLLKLFCGALSSDGVPTVLVDFYGITNSLELVRRLESAYDRLPQGKWSRAVKAIRNRGGGGALTGPVGGLTGSIGAADSEEALISALELPFKLAEKTGDRILVCFDEFQEVLKADLDGKIRASIQHHGDLVTYVFCGSHVGMMNELFADRSRPFFNQASPLDLSRFNDGDLIDFLVECFESTNRKVDDALDAYLSLVRGHPQRSMLAAHLLWEETPLGGSADTETVERSVASVRPYVEGEFEAIWNRLKILEARVLKAVASGASSLRSKVAQAQFGLPANSTGVEAAERLATQGILISGKADGRVYAIDDPFLERWILNDRKWL